MILIYATNTVSLILKLTIIAHPCVALLAWVKPVLDSVKSESIWVFDFAIVANPKETFTAVAFQNVLQLDTIWAIILIAFYTSNLFARFLIIQTNHCFALGTVYLTTDSTAKLLLAFKACSLTCSAQ